MHLTSSTEVCALCESTEHFSEPKFGLGSDGSATGHDASLPGRREHDMVEKPKRLRTAPVSSRRRHRSG